MFYHLWGRLIVQILQLILSSEFHVDGQSEGLSGGRQFFDECLLDLFGLHFCHTYIYLGLIKSSMRRQSSVTFKMINMRCGLWLIKILLLSLFLPRLIIETNLRSAFCQGLAPHIILISICPLQTIPFEINIPSLSLVLQSSPCNSLFKKSTSCNWIYSD